MRPPLNLARQPFRNERLPTLLLGLGTLALLLATARHATVAWELLPGRARDVSRELASLEAEAQRAARGGGEPARARRRRPTRSRSGRP